MFKMVLRWLAELSDTIGEFLDVLADYPGLGFLRPVGDWFGGWADSYAEYTQKIEWKKGELLAAKNKAGELAELVTPGGKDEEEESPAPVAAGSMAEGGELQDTARGETRASGGASPGGSRSANLSGTIIFDTTVVEPEESASSAPPRETPGPSRRTAEKPAYYGTLDSPGQSLSGQAAIVPPDYAPAPPSGGSAAGPRQSPAAAGARVAPVPPVTAAPFTPEEPPPRRKVPPVAEEPYVAEEQPLRRSEPARAPRESARPGSLPAAARDSAAPAPAAMSEEEAAIAWSLSQASSSRVDEDQPALIPLVDREEELARLEYLCCRLREAREPLCGVNGTLILIPLALLREGTRENVELPRAIQADLLTLQESLGLRFPTTTLLVGLEEHRGFEELVRRIGPQRAGSQRLGHRFDIRLAAVPAQLAVLCARLTGVFEDWVYAIFREHGSIARPGNSQLFGLLCQVRTDLQPRLLRILSGGFGRDRQEAADEQPLGFSGCYFAATGRSEDRRAFVRGVFDKLTEEQNQVEWIRQARVESRRHRRLGWLGLGVAAAFVAWLVFELWIRP